MAFLFANVALCSLLIVVFVAVVIVHFPRFVVHLFSKECMSCRHLLFFEADRVVSCLIEGVYPFSANIFSYLILETLLEKENCCSWVHVFDFVVDQCEFLDVVEDR